MDQLHALDYGLGELRAVIGTLAESELELTSNCELWTVRRLASHALNNQLLWAGLVTGEQLVSVDDTMGAVPFEGDLAPIADDVVVRAASLWRTAGVLDDTHASPFGDHPGSVVILFAIVDALAHAWDLAASVGRPIEFDPAELPWIGDVVAATCTDDARRLGLIKPPVDVLADATETERLMAAAGRSVARGRGSTSALPVWGEHPMRVPAPRAHDRSCSSTCGRAHNDRENPMILATTQFADWDQFWNVFSTVDAEKRAEHGCKGARVFRDDEAADRVWVAFDWDDAGWQSFVTDPTVPAVMKDAGHLVRPYTLTFHGAIEA